VNGGDGDCTGHFGIQVRRI